MVEKLTQVSQVVVEFAHRCWLSLLTVRRRSGMVNEDWRGTGRPLRVFTPTVDNNAQPQQRSISSSAATHRTFWAGRPIAYVPISDGFQPLSEA